MQSPFNQIKCNPYTTQSNQMQSIPLNAFSQIDCKPSHFNTFDWCCNLDPAAVFCFFLQDCSMSKSPCHTHNNACFYWTTSRNATPRESHTLGVFGQCLHTCASFYPPSSSRNHITSHHPTPRIASVRLLLDSCARRLVARTSPTLSGRGRSGVHGWAICCAVAAAWNGVRRRLVAWAPPAVGRELGHAHRTGQFACADL